MQASIQPNLSGGVLGSLSVPQDTTPTFGACSELCWRTVYRICMLLGFLAFDSSLKITNLIVVPRLSLCALSSSLQERTRGFRAEVSLQLDPLFRFLFEAFNTQKQREWSSTYVQQYQRITERLPGQWNSFKCYTEHPTVQAGIWNHYAERLRLSKPWAHLPECFLLLSQIQPLTHLTHSM